MIKTITLFINPNRKDALVVLKELRLWLDNEGEYNLLMEEGIAAELDQKELGVRIIAFISGITIGPPADNEYAVEPVGVATIIPSP